MTALARLEFTQTFKRGIDEFVELTGKSAKVFMREEVFRLLMETCYHWTAPPTKGNRGSRGGRKGGKATVAMSITSVMGIRENEYLRHLEERFGGSHISDALISKRNGTRFVNVEINRDGNQNRITEFHNKRRRSGTGRTYGAKPKYDRKGESVRDRMLTTESAVKRYTKNTQQRVGKQKAGWGPGLKASGSTLPQSWSKKAGDLAGASGAVTGTFSDKMTGLSGYLEAKNNSPYFRDDGFMTRASQNTERFFDGERFEKWMRGVISKHMAAQGSRGAR